MCATSLVNLKKTEVERVEKEMKSHNTVILKTKVKQFSFLSLKEKNPAKILGECLVSALHKTTTTKKNKRLLKAEKKTKNYFYKSPESLCLKLQ